MAYLPGLLTFSLLWLATVASPGPNFLRISHLTLAHSPWYGFAMSCGTALGNSLWCSTALFGATQLATKEWIVAVMQICGAGYLVWCGIKSAMRARRGLVSGGGVSGMPGHVLIATRWGVVTALSNPQAIAFFATAHLLSFPTGAPASVQWSTVLLVAFITLAWYAVVIGVLGRAHLRRIYLRFARFMDAAFAAILLVMAARLAWTAIH